MKAVVAIYQNILTFLDHLGPLCCLLDIPLLTTEPKIKKIAEKYYKNIKIILHLDYLTMYKFTVENFDIIFSCQLSYSDYGLISVLKTHKSNYILVWVPHGHSDKGWQSNVFQALEKEKITLVYGEKMLNTFKKQKVFNKIKHKITTGNFRYKYFLKNKNFYLKTIHKEIKKKVCPKRKTILYAPTWEDYESNSSYKSLISILTEKLPADFNLLVKPHPNNYIRFNSEVERMHILYEKHPNIFFIKDFPPIYPLLYVSDIYLGDMSSIGYDFLVFDRPMFFINNNLRDSKKDLGLFLFRCGIEIFPNQYSDIYSIIKNNLNSDSKFSAIRKKTYNYTFCETPDFNEFLKNIKKIAADLKKN